MDAAAVEKAMQDSAGFQNTVRSKLMKRGGPGYMQPDAGTFPQAERLHELARQCGALPCAAWLDGLSAGEQAMDELLDAAGGQRRRWRSTSCPTATGIWPTPRAAAMKQQKLYEVVDPGQRNLISRSTSARR
jgi:hypothetical protein